MAGEPSLTDRIAALERRLAELEQQGETGLAGTDQNIKDSHDRLDALLGAGNAAPDGTLVTNLNADLLDGQHGAYYRDADTVDTFHAAAAATASTLVPLTASSVFPADTVDFDGLTLAAQVWAQTWNDATSKTFTDDDTNWDDDSVTTSVTLRRKSDVIVIGDIAWNQTTARINNWEMRWDLSTTSGTATGNVGNTASTVMHTIVHGVFAGKASGAHTLTLQCHKTQAAQQTDDVTVYLRNVIILILPAD